MTGMKNNDAGMMDEDTGMISQDTGMINGNTGMLEENTGMINEDSGLITENSNEEDATTGRRKRSRERGKDAKPRDFPLHTLKNLPQFRNKSHEEVRQYILEKKGVDIGGNVNWDKMMFWILVGLAVVVGAIGVWKLWKQQNCNENTEISENIHL